MSVYKRPDSSAWQYKFVYKGITYRGTTQQRDRRDAEAAEAEIKKQVRHQAAGIAILRPTVGPTFQDWAEVYYEAAAKQVKRPERIEDLTRVGLRFWGRCPETDTPSPSRPYHDLRLTDVVDDPSWLLRWETWLEMPKLEAARTKKNLATHRSLSHLTPRLITWSAQTKNQYRSWLSRMFHLAMSPPYRLQTGVTANPLAGMWRDRAQGRTAVLSAEDVTAIISKASYHARLAIAIGMLASKLREGNILALEWDKHISPDFKYITVHDHKTDSARGPLVVPVSDQLREILQAARKRRPLSRYVISYKANRVHGIQGAIKNAVERAAAERPHLKYGRSTPDGVTFHTLRHTAATMMLELDVPLKHVMDAMGHLRVETTLKYAHLRPRHEAAAVETLSGALPMAKMVMQPWTSPKHSTVTKNVTTPLVVPQFEIRRSGG